MVQEAIIIDKMNKPFLISFWGHLVENECGLLYANREKHPVIVLMRVRVGGFNGTSLSTRNQTGLMVEPDIPQAAELRHWYDTTQDKAAHSLNSVQFLSTVNSPCPKEENLFKTTATGLTAPENAIFWIKGRIQVEDFEHDFFYKACSKCKRGTSTPAGITFCCSECGARGCVSTERVSVGVEIVDSTGKLPAQLYGGVAASFCGLSEKEIIDLVKSRSLSGNENLMQNIFELASAKRWSVQVKCAKATNMSVETAFSIFALEQCEELAAFGNPPVKKLKFSIVEDNQNESIGEKYDARKSPDEIELTPLSLMHEKVDHRGAFEIKESDKSVPSADPYHNTMTSL